MIVETIEQETIDQDLVEKRIDELETAGFCICAVETNKDNPLLIEIHYHFGTAPIKK